MVHFVFSNEIVFVNKIFQLLHQKQSGHLLGQWQLKILHTSVWNSTPSYCPEKLIWRWTNRFWKPSQPGAFLLFLKSQRSLHGGHGTSKDSPQITLLCEEKHWHPKWWKDISRHIQHPTGARIRTIICLLNPRPVYMAYLTELSLNVPGLQINPVTCWHVNNFIMDVFLIYYAYRIKFHFIQGTVWPNINSLPRKREEFFPSAPGTSSPQYTHREGIPITWNWQDHSFSSTKCILLQKIFL